MDSLAFLLASLMNCSSLLNLSLFLALGSEGGKLRFSLLDASRQFKALQLLYEQKGALESDISIEGVSLNSEELIGKLGALGIELFLLKI